MSVDEPRARDRTLGSRFATPHARMGWFCIAFGVVAWLMFGRHADWQYLRFIGQSLERTQGTVLSVVPGGFTRGDGDNAPRIQRVELEFVDSGGRRHRGVSWIDPPTPKRGDRVDVEFVESHPEIHRMVNGRSGALPFWAGLVLAWPIFGIWCILRSAFGRTDPPDPATI